ncbi:DUF1788 domain-containing protein [Fusobacterium sp. PH5-44]|uniref:DUF1788 domain-containing protein n=1 Tax=unclassified Fusobacterium TaxID=2648384 RepID=UPI003D1F88BF
MKNIGERFSNLIEKVRSEEFFHDRGLANDIPFYIFDYTPNQELEVREYVKNEFLPKLQSNERLKVVEVDLYDLFIEHLKNVNIFENVFVMEEKKGTKILYEKLKKAFNMEVILEYIEEKTEGKNMLIITGVGKIFPIVRTHAILNNLQTKFEGKVLLFFPGEYTTTDLRLFGIKENNYYRAFRI